MDTALPNAEADNEASIAFNPLDRMPSYMVAADNHNIASGSWSMVDYAKGGAGAVAGGIIGSFIPVPVLGTLGGAAIGSAIGAATIATDGKFAAASILSGANSFYNTGIMISNYFSSAQKEQNDTEAWISSLDSNLGEYYRINKQSSDLGGFIGGSMIPTVGALKVYGYGAAALNGAKAGRIGANFSGATGLLGPRQAEFLNAAITEMAAGDTAISLTNANMLKAFALGTAEEAIQGAVASVAVLATMKQSPILEAMDAGDIGWNVLEGALFGGVVGGVIRNAGAFGFVNKGISNLETSAKPYFFGERLAENNPVANKLINSEDVLRSRLIPKEGEENYGYKSRKYDESTRKWSDESRILSRELASGDTQIGGLYADTLASIRTSEEVAEHLVGVTSISRVTVKSPQEIAYAKALKNSTDVTKELTAEEVSILSSHNVTYLKYYGENAGAVLDELKPGSIGLADRMPKGSNIQVSADMVAGKYKQQVLPKKPWDVLEATTDINEARNIWAIHPDGLKFKTVAPKGEVLVNLIHDSDIAVMKGAYVKNAPNVTLVRADGSKVAMESREQLFAEINLTGEKYLNRMQGENNIDLTFIGAKEPKFTTTDMAKRLDYSLGYIEGTAINTENAVANVFAMKQAAEEYTSRMVAAGRWSDIKGTIPVYTQPQFAKIVTDTSPVVGLNGHILEGLAVVKEQQRLTQIAINNAVASVVGPELYSQMQEFTARQMMTADKAGPGQQLLKGSNQNYGTVGSATQYMGNLTARFKKVFNANSLDTLNPSLYQLKNNSAVALEFEAQQTMLRATPEIYHLDVENSQLILRRVKLANESAESGVAGKQLAVRDPKAPEIIPIKNPETLAAWQAHIDRNGVRVGQDGALKSVNGYQSNLDPQAAYPIPRSLRDYPHFAFVVDDTISGTGHTSMIYGATPQELDNLISKVRAMPEKLTVITKGESERFHKAIGDYNKDEVVSENWINTALSRNGVSSDFIPRTDPKLIADRMLQWHIEKDNQLARYVTATKYSKEFAELRDLAESNTNLATSKVGASSLTKFIEGKVDNPYIDYIKTALDVTSIDQTPVWTAVNNFTDRKVSEYWGKISAVWKDSKGISSADEVNKIFSEAGIKTAFYDAALIAHSNHVAPQGALQTFVSRANAILATTLLRMDPMNAFNNTVGSVMLTGSEIKGVLNGISKGDAAAVGVLAKITVPGTSDTILSPTKLYASSIKRFFTDDAARVWAKDNGFSSRHLQEYQSLLEDITLSGKETVKDLESRLDSAYQKLMRIGDIGERVTGNKLAEEFNRFVSADMMKQVTDLAVKQGVMEEANALSYINTFVNRTQGNYLASQRPLMFQGAIGSAVGLFQTYQFNLAQQLLRNVADGSSKTAALALGLQSTIYGMHGLPGFDYINAHIIGTMSGNKNHRDLYDATYGIAGKSAGDWLMYGMASNIGGLVHPDLKANLYTRGDINPRYATIVPTTPADIPIISASAKMFSSMKAGMEKIASGGAVWPSILQAIEHAGINRPLAGLAQTLEALGNPTLQSYSTTGKGNVIATNDLFSLANLTRIAGAKPLDEAITLDSGYRLDAYKAKDLGLRQRLGEAIKTATIGNGQVSQEQVTSFAEQYAKLGGKSTEFNQFFMDAYKNSNTSKSNLLQKHLQNPQVQSMQKLMGGYDLKDFSNSPQ